MSALTASPVLTPGASWTLLACAVVAVGAVVYRGIMAGPDALAEDEPVFHHRDTTGRVVPADHRTCEAYDCHRVLCYCDTVRPCDGVAEPGCGHIADAWVCDEHRLAVCSSCRDGARHDAGVFR